MKITFTLVFSALLFFVSFAQNEFKVDSVYPGNNSMFADRNTSVTIYFNTPVDENSISDTSVFIFGRWSGGKSIKGVIIGNSITFHPDEQYSAGELVMVSLSKKLKNAEGESLQKGYSWLFWIKPDKGSLNLTRKKEINVRMPGEGWIQTYGAYAADLNNDGYTDFIVPNERPNDVRVFMNDSTGDYHDFVTYPMPGGSRPSTNEASDFNLDGKIDFAVGNSTNTKVTVFLGDGMGGFSSTNNYEADLQVRGLAVMDLDGDGFMDITTANREGSSVASLINSGNGMFNSPLIFNANSDGETGCFAADANNDGIMDLFVGALYSREIILLLGDGEGNLNFSSKVSTPGSPWMVAAGDIDGDGNVDCVSANSNNGTFSVVRGDGQGGLYPAVTYPAGGFPIAVDLGDLDGDGDLEVVVSNYSTGNYILYENDGIGNFINPDTLYAVTSGSCAVFHDRDNDGDLDMTGIDEIQDLLILFDNPGAPVSVNDKHIPHEFALYQNYPNPFNPTTNLRFTISDLQFVELKVYDILGNEIATLVNEEKLPGKYDVKFDAGLYNLSSGVYIYRLNAGNFIQRNKMLLLK